MNDLVASVTASTEPYLDRGVVALYVHGSQVGGDTDAWSDLDVCYVHEPTDDARRVMFEWRRVIDVQFGYRVDGVGVSTVQLAAPGWRHAYLRRSLLARARLLLGRDVRPSILPATAEELCVGVAFVGMTWLRRFYDMPRWEPFPADLSGRAPAPLDPFPYGTAAWQYATGVLQLLRALVMLSAGHFCETRAELLATLEATGESTSVDLVRTASDLRERFPRFEPVDPLDPALAPLAEAVPVLAERLRVAMAAQVLADPSHQPLLTDDPSGP